MPTTKAKTDKPPRGLWFDTIKNRWRVRVYRNGVAYLPRPVAFFETYEEALAAHSALRDLVKKIPKTKPSHETDLMALWRQCASNEARHRVVLHIATENIP